MITVMCTQGLKRTVSTVLTPFVDSFAEDTDDVGLNVTLANTTPPTTNGADAADVTDLANTTEAADPADAANADLLEALANDGDPTDTNLEQDRAILSQSPVPQGSFIPQPAPTQQSQPDANNSNASPPLVVNHFPHGSPGAPVPGAPQGTSSYQTSHKHFGASCWAPFQSQCDWEIAHWAKMRGPSSSAMEELLAIPGVCADRLHHCVTNGLRKVPNKLRLSFSSTKELNHIIDTKLPGRPQFQCCEVVIGGETLELYYRDIIPCIQSIYGNPELAKHLITAPECHYSNPEQTERIYSEMHTCHDAQPVVCIRG